MSKEHFHNTGSQNKYWKENLQAEEGKTTWKMVNVHVHDDRLGSQLFSVFVWFQVALVGINNLREKTNKSLDSWEQSIGWLNKGLQLFWFFIWFQVVLRRVNSLRGLPCEGKQGASWFDYGCYHYEFVWFQVALGGVNYCRIADEGLDSWG